MKVRNPKKKELFLMNTHLGDRFIHKGQHYVVISENCNCPELKVSVGWGMILTLCLDNCELTIFDDKELVEIVTEEWIIE